MELASGRFRVQWVLRQRDRRPARSEATGGKKAKPCAMGYHAMCSQNLDVRFCYECEGIIEHEGWCSQKKCYCYCHYAGG